MKARALVVTASVFSYVLHATGVRALLDLLPGFSLLAFDCGPQ